MIIFVVFHHRKRMLAIVAGWMEATEARHNVPVPLLSSCQSDSPSPVLINIM